MSDPELVENTATGRLGIVRGDAVETHIAGEIVTVPLEHYEAEWEPVDRAIAADQASAALEDMRERIAEIRDRDPTPEQAATLARIGDELDRIERRLEIVRSVEEATDED